MKRRIGILLAVIIIAVLGWFGYRMIIGESDNTDTKKAANQAKITPTPAPTVIPTPPIRTELENTAHTLYPAYQYINGEKKYGYIDGNATFVISPRYDSATDFSEGYAVVYDKNRFHVIDTKGTIIFDNDLSIEPFHNGAAVFGKYDGNTILYGYIDTTGKIILEPAYLRADAFNENHEAYVLTSRENRYARIDKNGTVLESWQLDPKYQMVTDFKDGYLIYSSQSDAKQGVITISQEEILKPIYSDINYLGEDLFAVKAFDVDFYDMITAYPFALYNKKGEPLTKDILYDVSSFQEGYASATDSTSTFFIDKEGKAAANLPKYEGRGTLTLIGDTVKAEIDDDLLYAHRDGTVFWHSDHTYQLASGISISPVKYKPNKYVAVYYPQIQGMKNNEVQTEINQKLMEIFTKSRSALKEEDRLSVEDNFTAELLGNLLMVQRTGYDYFFGSAHGMPIRDYYPIDINTGKFYELKDLFKEGSDYVSKLNEIIKADIEKESKDDSAMYFPDGFQGIAKDQHFQITPDALVIYFYPYDIAPYAAGFPEFSIPYDQLNDIINQSGDFWKSFH